MGLGKTHLMQAIGNYIIKQNPSLKVMYVTSEIFTNELIESIKTEKNTSNKNFREKYRNVDVLLIDDIQFIIGKESTQDEFFHTFNTLREAKNRLLYLQTDHLRILRLLKTDLNHVLQTVFSLTSLHLTMRPGWQSYIKKVK